MMRIHHSWDKWECYKHNFHGGVLDYDKNNTEMTYANLLRDLKAFDAALMTIITTWKYSCEHNLSNEALNRLAWLGQAACALVYNVPNSISMSGYNLLTQNEQAAADKLAQKYLDIWLEQYEPTQKVS